MSRDLLREGLRLRGIDTRTFFIGMHQQPAFHDIGLFTDEVDQYPVCDDISDRGLYLPTSATLTETDLDYICEQIASARG